MTTNQHLGRKRPKWIGNRGGFGSKSPTLRSYGDGALPKHMAERRRLRGFTLIELLVVIAIIAILGAMLMPAFATANDKSNITRCAAHLQHIGMALRMFAADRGRYPRTLQELYDRQYLDDESALYCTKTGKQFVYERPGPGTGRRAVIASCVKPDTQSGDRPHGFGTVYVVLRASGKVEEMGE